MGLGLSYSWRHSRPLRKRLGRQCTQTTDARGAGVTVPATLPAPAGSQIPPANMRRPAAHKKSGRGYYCSGCEGWRMEEQRRDGEKSSQQGR